jgi:hypothetical protein
MHLQVKAKTTKGGTMSVHDDDDGEDIAVSATYQPGSLVGLLNVLDMNGFNLRAASGNNVELGGEFSFWVDGRHEKEDNHEATHAAAQVLRDEGYDAEVHEVHARHLSDTKGTLKEFVDEVTAGRLLVQEISVGTPDKEGIPVQIFTAKVRRHPARD